MVLVEVQLTDHIRSAFGLVLEKKKGINDEDLAQIRTYNTKETRSIPFAILQSTSKSLQLLHASSELPDNFPMFTHELIRGSNVIVPSIADKVDTPEAIEKREKLEAYVSNLRYRKMVQNISRNVEQEEQQDKAEMADFRSQLGMGLNIVFSILVAMIIGWYIGSRIFHSDVTGIMIGLVLMIGALVVETSLFTIHLSQVDMKKEKEVKKNLARDNQERFNGGSRFNMTPHLLQLSKTHKTQSYDLDGKELVIIPSLASSPSTSSSSSSSLIQTSNPTIDEITIEEPTDENDRENRRRTTKKNKKTKS